MANNDKTDYAAEMKAAAKRGDKDAYYTAQRKRAEKLAASGDRSASAQAAKIYNKTAIQKRKSSRENVGQTVFHDMASVLEG